MSFGYQVLGFGSGGGPAKWLEASGGTTVEYSDGGVDYKAHFYLSSGSFNVAALGEDSDGDKVDYFVIAGGGGAGGTVAGGGGAGGSVTASSL